MRTAVRTCSEIVHSMGFSHRPINTARKTQKLFNYHQFIIVRVTSLTTFDSTSLMTIKLSTYHEPLNINHLSTKFWLVTGYSQIALVHRIASKEAWYYLFCLAYLHENALTLLWCLPQMTLVNCSIFTSFFMVGYKYMLETRMAIV